MLPGAVTITQVLPRIICRVAPFETLGWLLNVMVVLSPGIAVSIRTQGDPPVDLSQSACHILAPEAPAPLSNLAGPAYPLAHIAPSGPSTRLPPAAPCLLDPRSSSGPSSLGSSPTPLCRASEEDRGAPPAVLLAHGVHTFLTAIPWTSLVLLVLHFPTRLSTFLRAGAGPRLPLFGCRPGPCWPSTFVG